MIISISDRTITIGEFYIMKKPKLTIEEQIEDMKSKNITFQYVSEKEAADFLRHNNYYFKLKSYGKNYEKYRIPAKAGQYVNLDFSYLQELSTLDMHLRKLILSMALDIEHALKTKILFDLSNNADEDGYSIIQKYLDTDYTRRKDLYDKIGNSAASDLIRKRKEADDSYAMWEIVEVLSFGKFIDLYQLYYSIYKSPEDYSSFLWSVKFLRNAAAHNNCLLNSLKAPYHITIHKTKEIQTELAKIKTISQNQKEKWMSNPVIHDFICLVYVYVRLIKSKGMKQKGISELNELFTNRMSRHKIYFEKNDTIMESYRFVSKTISYLCNKYRK